METCVVLSLLISFLNGISGQGQNGRSASDILGENLAFETSVMGLPRGFGDSADGSTNLGPGNLVGMSNSGFVTSQGTPITSDISGGAADSGFGSIFSPDASSTNIDTFVSLPGANSAIQNLDAGIGVSTFADANGGTNTANGGVQHVPITNSGDNIFNANNVFNTQANTVTSNPRFVDLVAIGNNGFEPLFDTSPVHNDISQTNGHSNSRDSLGSQSGVRVDELIDQTNMVNGVSIVPKHHRGEHNNLNNEAAAHFEFNIPPTSNNAHQGPPIEIPSRAPRGRVDVPVSGNVLGHHDNSANDGTHLLSAHIDMPGEHDNTGTEPRVHITSLPAHGHSSNNNINLGTLIETPSGINQGRIDVPVSGNVLGHHDNSTNDGTHLLSAHIDMPGEHDNTGTEPRVHITSLPAHGHSSNNNINPGLPIETPSGINSGIIDVPVSGNVLGHHDNSANDGTHLLSAHIDMPDEHNNTGDRPLVHITSLPAHGHSSNNDVNLGPLIETPSGINPGRVEVPLPGSGHDVTPPSDLIPGGVVFGSHPSSDLLNPWIPIEPPADIHPGIVPGSILGSTRDGSLIDNSKELHKSPGNGMPPVRQQPETRPRPSTGGLISLGGRHIDQPRAHDSRTDKNSVHIPLGVTMVGSGGSSVISNIPAGGPAVSGGVSPEPPIAPVPPRQVHTPIVSIAPVRRQSLANLLGIQTIHLSVPQNTIREVRPSSVVDSSKITSTSDGEYGRRTGNNQRGSRRGGGRRRSHRRGGRRRGGRRWGRRRGGRGHWSVIRNVHSHVDKTKATTATPPARINRRHRVSVVRSAPQNSYGNNRNGRRIGSNRRGLLNKLVRTALSATHSSRGRVRSFRPSTGY